MSLYSGRTTLSKFVIEHLGGGSRPDQLASLLIDVAAAVKTIAAITGKGALGGLHAFLGTENVHGDDQKRLDVMANAIFIDHCSWGGPVAGMLSAENEEPIPVAGDLIRGRYLLMFDPLDGTNNIELNASVGSIFSVVEYTGSGRPEKADFLQPGNRQVAAGYAIFGPATMLVLTAGRGTHGFTLDREVGNFVLTHPDLQIAPETNDLAINSCNERFWEAPIHRYVSECKEGSTGIRGKDFNMHWIASMVADVHRILMRGGVFMHPRDDRGGRHQGRQRHLYEASPMAFIVEQAGGAASTGRQRLLEVTPGDLHDPIPVILGSRQEIERIEQYHASYDAGSDKPFQSPLFNERSLYRADA